MSEGKYYVFLQFIGSIIIFETTEKKVCVTFIHNTYLHTPMYVCMYEHAPKFYRFSKKKVNENLAWINTCV